MKFIERRKRLQEIKQKIEEELQEWALQEKLLHPGEKIHFTIDIVKLTGKNKTPSVKCVDKGARVRFAQFKKLTDKDWKKILSVDWSPAQRESILKFKANNNESISHDDFFEPDRDYGFVNYGSGFHDQESVSFRFRRAGMPYRLIMDRKKSRGLPYRERFLYLGVMPDSKL